MALEQKTREYEILIRYNDDGKIGFHRQTITEIVSDGAVLSSAINPPEGFPLTELKALIEGLDESDIYVPPQPELVEA